MRAAGEAGFGLLAAWAWPDWAVVGPRILGTAGRVLAVIVIGHFTILAANRLIDGLATRRGRRARLLDERRLDTLAGVAKSAVRYVVDFVVLAMALGFLGVDTSSLLVGAGVAGLAVGFGAQNLVRDVLTGFFVLLENQFAVGDHVDLGGAEGVVEEIGLRTTTVRGFAGDLNIIPNGSLGRVTNYSRGSMRVLFEINVPYEEDTSKAITVVQAALDEYRAEAGELVTEGPKVLGVSRLGETGVSLMIWARSRPMEHWGVERELMLRVKQALDRAGIEIPHPGPWRDARRGEGDRPKAGPKAGE